MRLRLVELALLLLSAGCQTGGTIDATVPTTVFSLNEELKLAARLGRLPVPLEAESPIERYALQPTGASTEYLLIIMPERVDGKITVPVTARGSSNDSAVIYHSYLDHLLRAHRFIIRGELKEAEIALDQLDERYDLSYGALVLRGSLRFLLGDIDDAKRLYELAHRIYPGAKALEALKK